MAVTDRANLRASLQRKSDSKLTSSTDQDVLLDLAERRVLSNFSQFDKTLLRYAKDSAATDANGVVLLDAETIEVERVQSASDIKYLPIDVDELVRGTGYLFQGVGNSNTQKQILIHEGGSPVTNTTIEWYAMKLSLMGTAASAESVIPEEFREMIAIKAAQIYFEEQGPALISVARHWANLYGSLPDPPRLPQ